LRFDTGFFSALVAGLFFLSPGVAGTYTGKNITKRTVTSIFHEFILRQQLPIAFWVHGALSVAGEPA
jgi:hypothetical protein